MAGDFKTVSGRTARSLFPPVAPITDTVVLIPGKPRDLGDGAVASLLTNQFNAVRASRSKTRMPFREQVSCNRLISRTSDY